jgi:DNA-binding CsgD family transcriptional regulator
MNTPRPRAHVTIRTQDPALRARIAERLEALDNVSVEVEEAAPPQENGSAGEAAGASLTPRELEVLQLMADGLANKEIAARLSFSTHTAKFHVESLLRKLDAVNRAEAVREGIRRGFIGL